MLKAIETRYKGYRFRSRLEARWAVFFQEHGVRWEYEQEGFELPFGRYLPDFYLPTRKAFIEVKPGARPTYAAPRVYMAGRMGCHLKNSRSECYRPFGVTVGFDGDQSKMASRTTWQAKRMLGAQEILYVGPWQIEWGNHCAFHGVADDFCGYTAETLARSLDGIRGADVVFAMLEDREAHGTLVEIGYAKALGKRVVIGATASKLTPRDPEIYPPSVFPQEDSSVDLRSSENPLWFACAAADELFEGDRGSVLAQFEAWLARSYLKPREQILAEQLHAASGQTVVIVYGDPVEAFADDCANCFQARGEDEYPFFQEWSFQERDEAALKARQARFEFGEAGAPV